jgi:hypothetical protein
VAKGDKMLDQLVQIATSVYYNLDLTKKKEEGKRHHDFLMVLKEFYPPNEDLKSGPTTIVDRRDTSN